MTPPTVPSRRVRIFPWLVLLLPLLPAVWYVVDFEDDVDPEYPTVSRPTYSTYPPAAYRVAEPGDTLDRIAMYTSAAALVLTGWGWLKARAAGDSRLWPAAAAMAALAYWHSVAPGRGPSGWHGVGLPVALDPSAPFGLRITAGLVGIGLAAVVVGSFIRFGPRQALTLAVEKRVLGLLIFAACACLMRQLLPSSLEPAGFWQRWASIWADLAFALAMVALVPSTNKGRVWLVRTAAVALWVGLFFLGRGVIVYQRPIPRLKEAVPGRIYMSAMPSPEGLRLAHERHHFRTIINLFPEHALTPSPHYAAERDFARANGIRYLVNPAVDLDDEADEFLDETLRIAQDPSAWPILVHCHACMDRTPAWVGIYRFEVENRPLDAILREIEIHRGLRPKGGVTVLFDRVLSRRDPRRYAADPLGPKLHSTARGAVWHPPESLLKTARRPKKARAPGMVGLSR